VAAPYARLVRLAVLPAILVAVIGALASTVLTFDQSLGVIIMVASVGVPVCVVIVIVAVLRARSAASAIRGQLDGVQHNLNQSITTMRSWTASLHEEIQRFAQQMREGERPAPRGPEGVPAEGTHPLWFLAQDLYQAQHTAELAMLQSLDRSLTGDSNQRVAVFLNLSRRLQSLVHRKIKKLDELESNVEDPDLLKGLFVVDHLATGVRRQAENLAVLGGAVPRRQWSSPVSMYAVLRSAVAEVEQYARVKVVQPVEGTLRGHAVAEIIHLVAELVENATRFSSPDTQVMVRAQRVTSGLAIEIEDRGLGMPDGEQERINSLLAAPSQIDIGELLTDGRIGLWVVSELARRHNTAVRLRTNIFGGIDAVVVLPYTLMGDEEEEPRQIDQPPEPAVASSSTTRAEISFASASALSVSGDLSDQPGLPVPPTETPEAWGVQPPALSTGSDEQHDARPPLPKRRARTSHLAQELLTTPQDNEPIAEHDPGLMATFQQGLSRSKNEDDGPTERVDRRS
jgi:signal transduction histidine kinase